jgi:hypothetical protein
VFEVFDRGGRHIATVNTMIPFVPKLPFHVYGDHVYGIVNDADEVPYVVRARVDKRPSGGRGARRLASPSITP